MNYVIEGPPLSVNNSKAAVPVRGKLRMITTRKAREWKAAATWGLKSQKGTRPTINGPCTVAMFVYLKTSAGDADNYIKAALDALQDAGIIGNDRQVRQVSATKAKDAKRPRVEINIETL
jgi:Holliday junction resolvase RusA-like endonuclease